MKKLIYCFKKKVPIQFKNIFHIFVDQLFIINKGTIGTLKNMIQLINIFLPYISTVSVVFYIFKI